MNRSNYFCSVNKGFNWAKNNASNFFPIDLNIPEHNSEPARHILKNADHIITWPILAPAKKEKDPSGKS